METLNKQRTTKSEISSIDAQHKWILKGAASDYEPLLRRIGNSTFVLLGEASHGTHEFYRVRAEITQRLITEKQFTAVAVEADWPDAYRVNRFVRGESEDAGAAEALSSFKRFPTWMWRNSDVFEFVNWLRRHNDSLGAGHSKAGFYGLDLYSLHESMNAVLQYLNKIDPEAARRARYRYSCFDHFGEDAQRYGYAAQVGLSESCQDEVVKQLTELRQKAADYSSRDGRVAADEFFFAEQNARLVKNAEEYYRSMFRGRVSSWNLRDRHMSDTLDALFNHLQRRDGHAKVVVWAHNSHLGDARATDMGSGGELNVGQLARERHGADAVLIGFSTYAGTVTAASDWDTPAEKKRVRAALADSYERLFHDSGMGSFGLLLTDESGPAVELPEPLLQRAIGVVYRPETERLSHYFHAQLTHQFDAMLHIDVTSAVEPLERTPEWETGEWETFPSGM
jgi:erythromycin esterase-like protein